MQQLGPLLTLAQQQATPPPAHGGPAPPAPTPAAPAPAAAPQLAPSPSDNGVGAAPPGGDTSMAFAPIRQPTASHGGPYSSS